MNLDTQKALAGRYLAFPEERQAIRERLNGCEALGPYRRIVLAVQEADPPCLPETISDFFSLLESRLGGGGMRDIAPPREKPVTLILTLVQAGLDATVDSDTLTQRVLDDHKWHAARALIARADQRLLVGEDPDAVLADFHRPAAESDRVLELDEFLRASLSYRGLMADETPVPQSLIGNGLFAPRQIGEIHAPDGEGKSWAVLHLLAAASCGAKWFGIPTRAEGVRCGYFSGEDPVWEVKKKTEAIVKACGLDQDLLDKNLQIIAPPHFDGQLDILEPAWQETLDRWISHHALELVGIDHLSEVHTLVDERDLRPVFVPLRRIARERGSGILLNHHERKSPAGTRGGDKSASRGDSRFPAACRFRVAISKRSENLYLLTFEKASYTKPPAPIWLCHSESGALVVTESPSQSSKQKAQDNRAAIKKLFDKDNPTWQTGALADRVGLSKDTVLGHLEALGAQSHGHGRSTAWTLSENRRPSIPGIEYPDD